MSYYDGISRKQSWKPMAETRTWPKHTSRQRQRRQEISEYQSNSERLIAAVRIAAKATSNAELAKTLNEAADWMEAKHG